MVLRDTTTARVTYGVSGGGGGGAPCTGRCCDLRDALNPNHDQPEPVSGLGGLPLTRCASGDNANSTSLTADFGVKVWVKFNPNVSLVAQLVEHSAVNRNATGSSPV